MNRLLFLLLFFTLNVHAQTKPFRFVFISDTHIGSPNGGAEEDLRRTVADINSMKDVSFVVLTGDITELGTNEQLVLAKKILDSLHIPYYIIPGNHDTGWSESGGLSFTNIFGSDKFYFRYNGIHFIGCASGPYVRMSDGHIPREAMNWMKEKLSHINSKEPVFFLNHYPLDNGLDNWYEVIDLLKKQNTVVALCGHGHANRRVQAEEIPSVMGRSNLRAKAIEGGYNLVDVRKDSIIFIERKPFTKTENQWIAVRNELHSYDLKKKFPRPDFSVNENMFVKVTWTFHSGANVISTPVVASGLVVFGNQNGLIEAVDIKNGKTKWTYQTGGPIFSSPAFASGKIVLGSGDGYIYCMGDGGKLSWKFHTGGAVLGSPVIENDIVYIGGSDHNFRAINLSSGKEIWNFDQLNGPVVSMPVLAGDKIIFGAWDLNLYALNKKNGQLLWKWTNGSPVINYSPAACVPVIRDEAVYIVAPDRYMTAIDLNSGTTLWRTNEVSVRESMGKSEDGQLIYGKTMQDTIVAFAAQKQRPQLAWKMNAGYGYEHSPSMLIEKEGRVFFGTRNGLVYAINPVTRKKLWVYKLDNSMVNTLNVINGKEIIASTMDGTISLLQAQ